METKLDLKDLLDEVRACRLCEDALPLAPRPIVSAGSSATVLLIGQAPGTRVHESGVPWDDPSGDRLRFWLGVSKETFYDPDVVAIIPMGFCYPGKGKSGDLPPRPECAPAWHQQILSLLPSVQLTILIGSYAQKYYLGKQAVTLTETVRSWRELPAHLLPLPHPSPRNNIWLRRNPWFELEVLPELKTRLPDHLRGGT